MEKFNSVENANPEYWLRWLNIMNLAFNTYNMFSLNRKTFIKTFFHTCDMQISFNLSIKQKKTL